MWWEYLSFGVFGVPWGVGIAYCVKKHYLRIPVLRVLLSFGHASSFLVFFSWEFRVISSIHEEMIIPHFFGTFAVHVIGFVCGGILFFFFDDDDRKKRFKKKTSKALEDLIERVKQTASAPAPLPSPA